MEHLYWSVKCANCNLDLLLKDLGPYPGLGMMPILEDLEFTDYFAAPCETCGETHKYPRNQLMLVRKLPIARGVPA
jgi:hypothetical protein